jgi:hypothetical protein
MFNIQFKVKIFFKNNFFSKTKKKNKKLNGKKSLKPAKTKI